MAVTIASVDGEAVVSSGTHTTDNGSQCYICMQSDGIVRKSACECNADVHYKCLIQYCESAMTTQCTICQSGILDLQPKTIEVLNCTCTTVKFFANLVSLFFSMAAGCILAARAYTADGTEKNYILIHSFFLILFISNTALAMKLHTRMVNQGIEEQLVNTIWKVHEKPHLCRSV